MSHWTPPGNRSNQYKKYWLRTLYNDTQSSKTTYIRVLEDNLRVNTAKYAVGMRVSGSYPVSRFQMASVTGSIKRVADAIGRIEYLVQADDGSRHWILEDDIQVLSLAIRHVVLVTHESAQNVKFAA